MKLKDEWCQSKETEPATEVQAMLSFFNFLINLGFPEPLNEGNFDTSILMFQVLEGCSTLIMSSAKREGK